MDKTGKALTYYLELGFVNDNDASAAIINSFDFLTILMLFKLT